jgi:hypothetical protein
MAWSDRPAASPAIARAINSVIQKLIAPIRRFNAVEIRPTRQRRQWIETLESRRLLSGSSFPGLSNNNPVAGGPILVGLANAQTALTHLDTAGSLNTQMDLIGGKLGTKLDPASILDTDIFALSQSYFNSANSPTLQGWANYLQNNSNGDVTITSFPDVSNSATNLSFSVHLSKTVNVADWTINLPALLQADGVDTLGYSLSNVPTLASHVNADVEADLTLGYDSSNGGAGFYVTPGTMTIATQLSSPAAATVGLGMFSFVTGTLAGSAPTFTVNWADANSTNNQITSAELAADGASMFGATTNTSAVSLDLPLELSANALAAGSHIDLDLTSADAFNGAVFSIPSSSVGELIDTTSLTPSALATGLAQLAQAFNGAQNLPMLQQSLPLVSNETVGDVLNFANAISDGLNQSLLSVNSQGQATALFSGFDDLLSRLNGYCSAVSYDATTNVMSFTVNYAYDSATQNLPLEFSSVSTSPFSISTTSTVAANGSVNIAFTLGVQLAPSQQLATVASGSYVPTGDPTAAIQNGQLTSDVQFQIDLDGNTQYTVPVTASSTSSNNNLLDLVGTINTALANAGLGSDVQAYLFDPTTIGGDVTSSNWNTSGYNHTGLIGFRTITAGQYFAMSVAADSNAQSELGFAASQYATPTGAVFSLNNASLGGTVTLTGSNLTASASLGIVGFDLSDGTLNISGSGSSDIVDPDNSSHDIPLTTLISLSSDWDTLVSMNYAGSGSLVFSNLSLAGITGASLGSNPTLTITVPDITQPTQVALTYPSLGSLTDLQNVNVSQIVSLFGDGITFVTDADQTPALSFSLPGLNDSAADALGLASDLTTKLGLITTAGNSATSLQSFIQSLSDIFGSGATVSLTMDGNNLKLSLDYTLSKAWTIPFSLDASSLLSLVSGDTSEFAALSQLVDSTGAAKLNVSASGYLQLNLGLDLSNPSSPQAFVYDTSGLTITLATFAQDANFSANVGALGVYVIGGAAALNADGEENTASPATFTVTLNHHDGGSVHYFGDSSAPITADLSTSVSGAASFNLPIFYPTQSQSLGTVAVNIPSLSNLIAGQSGSVTMTAPDFAQLLSGVNINTILANPSVVLNGLSEVFTIAQSTLSQLADDANVPFVGSELSSSLNFVGTAGTELLSKLRTELNAALDGQNPATLIRQALYDAFGPSGLNILLDPNSNPVSINDVVLTIDPNNQYIQFEMDLGQTQVNSSQPFKLGITGVPLKLNGPVDVALGWSWDFGFGINVSHGLYLLAGSAHDLTVNTNITMPQEIQGQLFLLDADVTPIDDSGNPDYTDPIVSGTFDVDFKSLTSAGELAVSTMEGSSTASIVNAGFTGSVNADLQTIFSIVGSTEIPRIRADLTITQTLSDTLGEPNGNTEVDVEFQDVALDLGSLINGFLSPIFTEINSILSPIQPVLTLLNTPLPIIDLTLLELAHDYDPDSTYVDFLDAIDWIDQVSSDFAQASGSTVWIDLGGFHLTGAGTNDTSIEDTDNETDNFMDALDASSASEGTKSFMDEVVTGETGFHLNLLQPSTIFGLLMGQTSTLMSFELPELHFDAAYTQDFPIFGPLVMTLAGEIGATIHLGFGYDTYGLSEAEQTGDWADLINGFFVSDTANADGTGPVTPQVIFHAGIYAGAGLDLGFASGGVEGGIEGDAAFTLNDPNGDGKVRLNELEGNALQGIQHIFDIGISITAEVDWYLKLDFGFFHITKSGTLASDTLLSETYSASSTPVLASTDASGDLVINSGTNAANSLHGDTDENANQTINITTNDPITNSQHSTNGAITRDDEPQTVNVDVDGTTQQYTLDAGNTIIIDGGNGDDDIVVGSGVAANVLYTANGGNDYFEYDGSGNVTAYAGSGDDTIIGGSGDDSIVGGTGNDSLVGGGGDDTIVSGTGDDTMVGGAGSNDYVFDNGFGNDTLDVTSPTDTADFSNTSSALTLNPNTDTVTALTGSVVTMTAIPSTVIGSSDNDTLLSKDQNNNWTITGPNEGNYDGEFNFQSFEHLVGNAQKDTFTFENGGYISQMIDGGAGASEASNATYSQQVNGDILDFSAYTTSNRFQITGVNSGTIYSAYAETQFQNIQNINGGSASDYLVCNNNDYINGIYNGGTGAQNRIDLTDYRLTNTYLYNTIDITGTNSGAVNQEMGFSNVQNFSGGSDQDVFYEWPATTTGSYGAGFLHSPDGSGGALTGSINGEGDNNTINDSPPYRESEMLAHEAPALVMSDRVNRSSGAPNERITRGNTSTFYNGIDESNYSTIWTITGENSGTRTANGVTTDFTNTQNIVGSSGNDLFIIEPGGSLDGYIDGGGGDDALIYGWTGDDWTTNVNTDFLTRTQATTTAIGGYVDNIDDIVGGIAAANTLSAIDITNLWTLTGNDSGSFQAGTPLYFGNYQDLTAGTDLDSFTFTLGTDGSGDDTLSLAGSDRVLPWTITGDDAGNVHVPTQSGPVVLNFSSIGNIISGNANDTFTFTTNASYLASVNGGGGTDTVDLSQQTSPVTVNLDSMSMTPIGAFSNIESVIGSAGSDTLVGLHTTNAFDVTGANVITIDGMIFSSFGNLTGGAADDTFTISPGGSLTGNVVGGGQGSDGDTLDYSGLSTNVSVNLQTATATDIGGTVSGIENFTGGSGNNTITGPNQTNAWNITGSQSGNINGTTNFTDFDTLVGGTGTDILNATQDGNFSLSNTAFSNTAYGNFTLSGFEDADLTGGNSANDFTVTGWTGMATIAGGAGNDTITATANANFVLSDDELTVSGGGTFDLSGIDAADLTGGVGNNNFTVTDWYNPATLTGGGGSDTVTATRDANFTLSDSLLTPSNGGSFTLSGIANAVLTGGSSNNNFTVSGWTGDDTLTGGGGTDTVIATRDSNMTLTNSLLTITGGGTSALSGFSDAQLTGGSGNDAFTVSGWTGDATLTGGGGSDTVIATRDSNFTLADDQLSMSSGGTFDLSAIGNAQLTGGNSGNQFTVSGWTGNATIAGGSGTDTLIASRDADFNLADALLTISTGGNFALSGIEDAILTGGSSDNAFTVSGWTGLATLTGGGGEDTVIATRDSDFELADDELTIETGGTFDLSGIDNAQLTGGEGNNNFTVTDWYGDATLTGGGGTDTVTATRDANFTLTNSELTISNGGTFALSGIDDAVLTSGSSNDNFTVSGWTGDATLTGGGGTDSVIASRDADFNLGNTELTISTGGTFALSGITDAQLTGGSSDNNFTVSNWTGDATLTGGGGDDTVTAVRDSNFTLANSQLTISSGGTFDLSGIDQASLTGGSGGHDFTVSGWTGTATLTGGGGNDTVVAARDANFTLADDQLTISTGGTFDLSEIENAILTGGSSNNTFTVSGWTGDATLTGGGGTDSVIAARDADFNLADDELTISTGGTFDLSGIEDAQLTGGSSDNDFTVTGWTGNATLTGSGGEDTVTDTSDSDFTLNNSELTVSPGGTFMLSGIDQANLTGGDSDNSFTVTGFTGDATLTGGGGDDEVIATSDADFTLGDAELDISTGGTFTLSGIDEANLTGGESDNNFTVSGWTGEATLTGGGGNDTVTATRDSNFNLADNLLTISNGGTFTLSGFDNANLTGGEGGHDFTVSGWTGDATITGGGGNDTIVAARDTDFNLANEQLTLGNGGTFALSDIANADLTGGESDNNFTVTGWTGNATLAGGGGSDTVTAVRDSNFSLADDQLAISDGGTFALSGITNAKLTGGSDGHVFTVSGWTGDATLTGGGGNDSIVAARDANFNLADDLLTISTGGTFSLSGIGNADLTGGSSDNNFEVSDWTGTANLAGGGGSDTVSDTNDTDFTLSDQRLSLGSGAIFNLSAIANASLTGGAGDNTFTVSGWTGDSTLTGGGGTDSVIATRDANFSLTDSMLQISTGGADTLSGIERATLSGGASPNTFNVSSWTGQDTLSGASGNDTYNVDLSTAGTTTIADSGGSTGDVLDVTGSLANQHFTLSHGLVSSMGSVHYTPESAGTGIDRVSVQGSGAKDVFNVTADTIPTQIAGSPGTKATLNFNSQHRLTSASSDTITPAGLPTLTYGNVARIHYSNVAVNLKLLAKWHTGASSLDGGYVQATATVFPGKGMPVPTGTIEFLLNSSHVVTLPLVNGVVKRKLYAADTANEELTAVYSGDDVYLGASKTVA